MLRQAPGVKQAGHKSSYLTDFRDFKGAKDEFYSKSPESGPGVLAG
jgi:hypothetical protein